MHHSTLEQLADTAALTIERSHPDGYGQTYARGVEDALRYLAGDLTPTAMLQMTLQLLGSEAHSEHVAEVLARQQQAVTG